MNDLQQEFIRESVADLRSLAEKTRRCENEDLPADLLREIFRLLHTIKGTSQVFGLPASSHLAHTLENTLAAVKSGVFDRKDFQLLLPEGVEILAAMLAEKDFKIPASFAAKIQNFQSEPNSVIKANGDLPEFPAEFAVSLSDREKSSVNTALKNGCDIYIVEIGFEAANFAASFKSFRGALAEKGEIIAALPSAKFAAQNKIGFQIVYAAAEKEIEKIAENSNAEIIHRTRPTTFDDLSGVLAQIAAHGENLARQSGKIVEFEISNKAETPAPPVLKIVFDSLVHLVRNSVSHAFDERGKIIIEAKNEANNLVLKVADDGKGLDAEKILSKAAERNLVPDNRSVSAADIMNLIFAPDFSTAAEVSGVSGRGVGLDAVKTAVENAGGKISVESTAGAGTTFEIFLPADSLLRQRNDVKKENGTNQNQ